MVPFLPIIFFNDEITTIGNFLLLIPNFDKSE